MGLTFPSRRDMKWLAPVLIPIVIFYAVLLGTGFNLPRQDDYDSILRFMNGFETQAGFFAKLRYFLASQNNEYKLYYVHGVAIVQHALTHKVNFFFMQQLGNISMLGTFIILALNLPSRANTWKQRALLAFPISLFLFSLRSHQTLNWAMASLQNVSVLFFGLAAIHFILICDRRGTILAFLFFILAVAASGNGFVILLTGTWPLFEQRRLRVLAMWWSTGVLLGAAYVYHYSLNASAMVPISRLHSLASWAVFPVLFLGNAMPKFAAAMPFGLLLSIAFFVAVKRGLRTRSPFVFHASVFIIVTALGVSVTRHAGGIGSALPSRYSLYGLTFASLMLLALYVTHEDASAKTRPSTVNRDSLLVPGATGIALAFWLLYLPIGVKSLRLEKQGTESRAAAWEHDSQSTPIFYLENPNPGERESLEQRAPAMLHDSEQLGVYKMPPLDREP